MKKIDDFFNQLVQHMGFLPDEVKVAVTEDDQRILVDIQVPTDDSGMVIGVGGEVLTSMQRLARTIFFNQVDKKIQVNVNDYRQTRKEALEALAERICQEVSTSSEPVMIHKQLSSYERFVIHDYVASHHEELESLSEGESDNRRLVIKKKTKV